MSLSSLMLYVCSNLLLIPSGWTFSFHILYFALKMSISSFHKDFCIFYFTSLYSYFSLDLEHTEHIFLSLFIFFSSIYMQSRVWTHDPKVKSHTHMLLTELARCLLSIFIIAFLKALFANPVIFVSASTDWFFSSFWVTLSCFLVCSTILVQFLFHCEYDAVEYFVVFQ